MSKKLRGIGVQLVGFFVLAILIPTLILAFRAIETTKSAQTENLKLTSVQTLQETKMGFTNYLKNISQPIDLLTRNDAVKLLPLRTVVSFFSENYSLMPADSPFFPVILLALMQNPLHRYPSYPENILLPATCIFRPATHCQNLFYIPQVPRTASVCLSYEPPILSRLIAKLQYFLYLSYHNFHTLSLVENI